MSKVVGIWEAMPHSARRPTISVVIPALNEERNLSYIASRLPPRRRRDRVRGR